MTNDEEVPDSEVQVRYRFQRGVLSFGASPRISEPRRGQQVYVYAASSLIRHSSFAILSAAHEAHTASYFPKSFIGSLTGN
jgi:hypothetical protein